MLETWENLCDRLYHLGYLGEELESIENSGGQAGWLYREIAREAAAVVEVANAYADEFDLARAYHDQERQGSGDDQ
ncbi:MAG TPA: hypothetical protein VFW65_08150 [Pseudonocardiaceae bacterium]|nr:hypothetical protein [Pseudonocardiaceae bacterium]